MMAGCASDLARMKMLAVKCNVNWEKALPLQSVVVFLRSPEVS